MSQGPFSPKIRFLGQKVSSVARRQTDRKVKMVLKIPFFKISKNKKLSFFLMSQGSFSPKIRFLAQQVCSVARRQTDRKVKMAPKNPIFQNFEKQKIAFLSHVPRILQSKNQVPRPKGVLCSSLTDRQTDRQTDTKVNTEDTLSGFQEFFLQPIIKDRSNFRVCSPKTFGQNGHFGPYIPISHPQYSKSI